ncbi:uncharacterized protein C7orf26 homolog [Lingula anatina]|uniref:Uncharacterized protein C7orf26 homolog n=1 Tax=Lingula anatina TaxID=7574 RepID=A0A1S3ISP9_LINAN|nr:uncharacterized protein C7orf26 homolog [Lingula anatina]XP_023933678.1 uncharacterized protein C7orf26 homolog [Lingula anatina]XP_023933679.1 uncharacterized protein C7orf26 homolog [Lingula anatina]|eukprot:XP_013401232.1 uncharacterized protein C7orf26 homolog [Lingula anatina]
MESVEHLRHLEFPHSTQLALQYIQQHSGDCDSTSTEDRIPGLGVGSESITQELAQEFVFFQTPGRQKLSAIQEFQLKELLCNYFHEQKDGKAQAIFNTLFDSRPGLFQAYQLSVLSSLVSMGVAMKCTVLLDCAAIWIQKHGYSTQNSENLIRDLVKDYCLLIPGTTSVLEELPQISAKFACSFIAVTSAIYNMSVPDTDIPFSLLQLITKWVEQDPTLCLQLLPPVSHSLKTSSAKSVVLHTPILGLLAWSVVIPLKKELRTLRQNEQQSNGTKTIDSQAVRLVSDSEFSAETLCSRLHLGLLKTILVIGSSPQHIQIHLHIQDVLSLAQEVATLSSGRTGLKTVLSGAERLLQALQVAMYVKACRCQAEDLKNLGRTLPTTRLLDILLQRLSSTSASHEPMEH